MLRLWPTGPAVRLLCSPARRPAAPPSADWASSGPARSSRSWHRTRSTGCPAPAGSCPWLLAAIGCCRRYSLRSILRHLLVLLLDLWYGCGNSN
nr:MAG TPA: hypothetical protein [Caudoviricetes sp.]